jgi:pimeloyl-ACP methyl ester carboxylesterase
MRRQVENFAHDEKTDVTHPTDVEPIALTVQDWDFVGGTYVEAEDGTHLVGAMYVEHYAPLEVTQVHPVVMFHGGIQTGTNFTATPDGRRGWLHDFLRAGFEVYVVDQPERGRSGHALDSGSTAPLQRYSAERVEERFTAPGLNPLWPQASTHTQWPGAGRRGDEHFDRFFASQVEMLGDRDEIERAARDAGAALLDKIGPAILLTHSQSGPFGWLIADARPHLVSAILALEPNGPPFAEVEFSGGDPWFAYAESVDRRYGITRIPLDFEPPLGPNESLSSSRRDGDNVAPLVPSILQSEPARQLPKLAGIDILIITAEASYHAPYDHCTSEFLVQAGVEHDFMRLAERGLCGNGHMVMLEKNNHEVADVLIEWLNTRHQDKA